MKTARILNPGDPSIAPHEYVALGMVRKTFPYNMIEVSSQQHFFFNPDC
jgi:hypothetical protein